MPQPTLQELNAYLFASLRPKTHGKIEKPKAGKGKKQAEQIEQPAAPADPVAADVDTHPEYTAEQLALLAAAGATDPLSMPAADVAGILAALNP